MSEVVRMKLTDDQIARLDKVAIEARQTRSEMAATLVGMVLRLSRFPHIVLRDFGAGPEAFISGTRLRVWWVATLIRDYDGDIAKAAEHLNLAEVTLEEVQNYADAFPDEIEAAIADNERRADELALALGNPRGATGDLTVNAPAP
jgi:uncharacterized protein (DUF433 family)